MTQSALATAADYADAMITARKAKNILCSIIALMLLAELTLFFVARYRVDLSMDSPKTLIVRDLVAVVDFFGILMPVVLDVVLLLLVQIMLVGRLIGVSRVVAAFIWSVVITIMMFPWQAMLASTEMKIPGVLFNWTELLARVKTQPGGFGPSILFWARFVGWPVVAFFVVMLIQSNSRRGLRLAFGEVGTIVPATVEGA